MKTVTIDKLSNYEGKDVELKGWVYNTRNVGKIWFVIFRDGTGLLQGVVVKGEATDESFALENDLNQEDSVIITGTVRKEPRSIGGFELGIKEIKVVKHVTDEFPISHKEHEANRGPWMILKEVGVKIIEVKLMQNGTLDYSDFKNKINDKTVMVCMGMSSNALGTLNNFIKVKEYLKGRDCFFLLDAVHYAPHFSIDVEKLGCDFMLCSAYKFYGPHISFLYSRPGVLQSLDPDRLVVQDQEAPYIIETGTLNHASCAGVSAAIDFISTLGEGESYREKLESAYLHISDHEFNLAKYLYESLDGFDKTTVVGPDFSSRERTPTVSFVHSDYSPQEVCAFLAKHNICAWDSHFYALKAIQQLGLESKGGVTRLGISLYNTKNEIDTVVEAIKAI